MSKRLSVNEKSIIRHRYIIEKLATLKLSQLREVIDKAPDELFRVLQIILAANTKILPQNFDIKRFARAKVGRFRKLLIAAARYVNESIPSSSRE